MERIKFFWEIPLLLADVITAVNASYERELNPALVYWRFNQYPDDGKIYAAYAEENGRLACFVAHSPVAMITPQGERMRAGLMLMAMTHPDFRGKGLFTQMSASVNARLAQEGFNFNFAFANHNSHFTNRKYLNWHDVGVLNYFSLQSCFVKRLKNSDKLQTADLEMNPALCSRLAEFPVCNGQYHFERSASWLEWRLLQHPTNIYKAAGVYEMKALKAVIVYKSYLGKELDIMEIFYADAESIAAEELLSALISHVMTKGAEKLNIWSNLFSKEHMVLEKIGFLEDRFSTYFGIVPLGNAALDTDIRKWHYRFLDSDVF